MDAAAARHPEVPYEPVLIDATYAGPRQRCRQRAARDPDPEPRRRPAQRPGDADVRLDRRRRVDPAQPRRRAPPGRRDGRGAARHRALAGRQGRGQPDGDDPRLRRRPPLRRRARRFPTRDAPRRRSTTRPSAPPATASAPTTSAARHRPRRSAPRWSGGSRPPARPGSFLPTSATDPAGSGSDRGSAGSAAAGPCGGPSSIRRHSTILPSSISNEVDAVPPAPGPQSPPGRSESAKVAVVRSPVVRAETTSAPHGSERLNAIASARESIFVSSGPFSAVLGIAK